LGRMPPHKSRARPTPARPQSITWITLGVVLIALLFGARTMATYTIEVEWRKELGQFHTWLRMLWYSVVPQAVATLLALGALGRRTRARSGSPELRFANTASMRASPRWRCWGCRTSWRLLPSIPGRWCGSPVPAVFPRRPPPGTTRYPETAVFLSFRPSVLRPVARLSAGQW